MARERQAIELPGNRLGLIVIHVDHGNQFNVRHSVENASMLFAQMTNTHDS